MKILIVKLSAIGAVIHTLPALNVATICCRLNRTIVKNIVKWRQRKNIDYKEIG